MNSQLIKIVLLIFLSSLVFTGCSNDSNSDQGEIRVIRDLNNPNSELNKELTQIEMADKQLEMEKEIKQLKKELQSIKKYLSKSNRQQTIPKIKPAPESKKDDPATPKNIRPDTIIKPYQNMNPDRSIY